MILEAKKGALFIVFNYDFKIDPNPIKTQRGVNSICSEEVEKKQKFMEILSLNLAIKGFLNYSFNPLRVMRKFIWKI